MSFTDLPPGSKPAPSQSYSDLPSGAKAVDQPSIMQKISSFMGAPDPVAGAGQPLNQQFMDFLNRAITIAPWALGGSIGPGGAMDAAAIKTQAGAAADAAAARPGGPTGPWGPRPEPVASNPQTFTPNVGERPVPQLPPMPDAAAAAQAQTSSNLAGGVQQSLNASQAARSGGRFVSPEAPITNVTGGPAGKLTPASVDKFYGGVNPSGVETDAALREFPDFGLGSRAAPMEPPPKPPGETPAADRLAPSNAAAVKAPDGAVYRGADHPTAYEAMLKDYPHADVPNESQGFVTSTGRFISRAEAGRMVNNDRPSLNAGDAAFKQTQAAPSPFGARPPAEITSNEIRAFLKKNGVSQAEIDAAVQEHAAFVKGDTAQARVGMPEPPGWAEFDRLFPERAATNAATPSSSSASAPKALSPIDKISQSFETAAAKATAKSPSTPRTTRQQQLNAASTALNKAPTAGMRTSSAAAPTSITAPMDIAPATQQAADAFGLIIRRIIRDEIVPQGLAEAGKRFAGKNPGAALSVIKKMVGSVTAIRRLLRIFGLSP